MEGKQSSTRAGGVDVGKRHLDMAVHGMGDLARVENNAAGIGKLIAWLKEREVGRVGLEASGGYEKALRLALDEAGFAVVMHQPLEVRLFARLRRRRAKNDRLDAQIIAAATAQTDTVRAAQDPRLADLAERMSTYEHVTGQIAALKSFLESLTLTDMKTQICAQIAQLTALKARLIADILARIRGHDDLAGRFRLLTSLPGIGPIVAASLLIRMPELGAMRRGEAASLIGVAPFDRQSGQWIGQRFIQGGRDRPRRMLYLAALAARRCDASLKTFAQRLAANGKPPKKVLVAVMRKLIEAANTVLARGTPWVAATP